MSVSTKSLILKTHGPAELFFLMDSVREFLTECRAETGRLWVFSIGSTGAVVGLPSESRTAIAAFLNWVRQRLSYSELHRHPGNAFAHLRSTLLGTGISLAVESGLRLGPAPCLLENTAGRKRRPIRLAFFHKGGAMSWRRRELSVSGRGWIDMVDITGRVSRAAAESGVVDGQVIINVLDPESAVITIENEMRLVLDTADFIADLFPSEGGGRAAAGAVLGRSLAVPLSGGRLDLGVWQQIMLVDLGKPGDKKAVVDIIGE